MERRRTQAAGRAALVLVAVVLRHGRSANAGDRAGRGRAPLAAPRLLAPSLAWRGAGKLASRRAGSAPQKEKEREGRLTPPQPSPLSQREARSQSRCRAGQRQQPHGVCGRQPAGWGRGPTTPSMQCAGGASGRQGSYALLAARREAGSTGLRCMLGWGIPVRRPPPPRPGSLSPRECLCWFLAAGSSSLFLKSFVK